jgi:hypothetical protein
LNAPARIHAAPTLAELVQRAVTASDQMARLDAEATDTTFNYWERQSLNAREALLDRLADFGITKAMASKLGGVL